VRILSERRAASMVKTFPPLCLSDTYERDAARCNEIRRLAAVAIDEATDAQRGRWADAGQTDTLKQIAEWREVGPR
jgi:hypothetical protein